MLKAIGEYFKPGGNLDLSRVAGAAGLAGLVYGAVNPDSKVGEFLGTGGAERGPIGYTGGIPEFGITRALAPDAFSTTTPTGEPRRPGSAGRRYFTDTTFTPTGETMAAERLSPVNVPVTTKAPVAPVAPETQEQRIAKAQGIINSMPKEVVEQLLSSMFSGSGISSTPAPGPTPAPTYKDVDVKSFIDSTVKQYGGMNTDSQRAIADAMKEYGISAEQVSRATGIPVEEVTAAYKSFGYARGGNVAAPQSRGYYLGGTTDGMADQIPATINGTQQAALSDGEFVVPADVVSHLGNGNSDAGAKQLYSMMDRVRQARTGRQEQGRKIAPNKFIPV
jgi:hypothetical protein